MTNATSAVRAARDEDGASVIALIDAVYAEYPGCVLDVEGEEPGLLVPASHFAARQGRFWVAETGIGATRRLVGTVACVPVARGRGLELFKLYVEAAARGAGIGRRLIGLVEGEARRRGMNHVELWTDTRFADAHRLYEHLGYVRGPMTRALADASNSVEFHYRKPLRP